MSNDSIDNLEINEKESWINSADNFCACGDFYSMRASGQEILALNPDDGDGLAIMAEASLYLGTMLQDEEELARAEEELARVRELAPENLRGQLVEAMSYWNEFELDKAIPAFKKILAKLPEAANHILGDSFHRVMERACAFYADACMLAAEPEKAMQATFDASNLVDDLNKKAVYYSKGLFISNYRIMGIDNQLAMHSIYDKLLQCRLTFPHNVEKRRAKHCLRIGYISPDFRFHAVAHFFMPLFKYSNQSEFSVYAYSTGRADHVTRKLKSRCNNWRDVSNKTPEEIARNIYEDHIDILVDLSGHSQNSCLSVLKYRPAPVQLMGLGYVNTTGMSEVDYLLSDEVCMPPLEPVRGITETPLRLPNCHLCYSPDALRTVRAESYDAPVIKNSYVTFGSFNNFTKVTREQLLLWRSIMERVRDSHLIIKAKICSIPSGQEIVRQRLDAVGIDLSRIELRPYSSDYLEQYRDIDIALDTAPYNGGLTTCDALYMGTPVITQRGRSHGSRYGASILTAAGLKDLIAENDIEYVGKAVLLAKNKDLLNRLHHELPLEVRQSRLMDGKAYMAELEDGYKRVWAHYCGE